MPQAILNFLFNHTPLFYWTQSLWRDEAFSVWIAQDSIPELIRKTSTDFNPPLYYVLLNIWMKIFSNYEVTLRGLSLLFFLFLLLILYKFAKIIFSSTKWATFTTLLAAVNPMLVYFAFELRMYSLLVLLATLSMYFFYQKRWKVYILSAAAGMYTQPFMAFAIAAQMIYLLMQKQYRQIIHNSIYIGLIFAPWIPILVKQLAQSKKMWIYPVDINLVFSVLGNLYFGYEGTPGSLWLVMKLFTLALVLVSIWLYYKKDKQELIRLLYAWIFVPLIFVIGISYFKPIYVLRYVIFVTVGEIMLLSLFLFCQKNRRIQLFVASTVLFASFLVNFWTVSFHRKTPIRDTFDQIIPLLQTGDVVYAETPLVYYETLYYTPDTYSVYLYNPDNKTPPRYTGSEGMPPEVWADTYPLFPRRAFMIYESGEFRIVSKMVRSNQNQSSNAYL